VSTADGDTSGVRIFPPVIAARLALAFGGPYRFTRNPMDLGLVLFVLGVGLVMNSIWLILMIAPVAYLLRNAVILKEEQYLERV